MLVIFLKIVLTEHDLIYNKVTTNKPRWLAINRSENVYAIILRVKRKLIYQTVSIFVVNLSHIHHYF